MFTNSCEDVPCCGRGSSVQRHGRDVRLGRRAQVLEARVDHARVVDLLRKADHLPLVKEYLLAVQKTNLAAVNEAVRAHSSLWTRSP